MNYCTAPDAVAYLSPVGVLRIDFGYSCESCLRHIHVLPIDFNHYPNRLFAFRSTIPECHCDLGRWAFFPRTKILPDMFHSRKEPYTTNRLIVGLCRMSQYPRSSPHQRINCRVGLGWPMPMPSPPRASYREHRSIEQISPERHSLNINLMTSPPR